MLKRGFGQNSAKAYRLVASTEKFQYTSRILSNFFASGTGREQSKEPSENSKPSAWIDKEQHQEKHWLDRAFPGSREWLEDQNRKWWFSNVTVNSR